MDTVFIVFESITEAMFNNNFLIIKYSTLELKYCNFSGFSTSFQHKLPIPVAVLL